LNGSPQDEGKAYIYLAAVLPDGRSSSEMDTGRSAAEKRTYSDRDLMRLDDAARRAEDEIRNITYDSNGNLTAGNPRLASLYPNTTVTLKRIADVRTVYAREIDKIILAGGAPIEREVLLAELNKEAQTWDVASRDGGFAPGFMISRRDAFTPPKDQIEIALAEGQIGLHGAAGELGDALVDGGIVDAEVVEKSELKVALMDSLEYHDDIVIANSDTGTTIDVTSPRKQSAIQIASGIFDSILDATSDYLGFRSGMGDVAALVSKLSYGIADRMHSRVDTHGELIRDIAVEASKQIAEELWSEAQELSAAAKEEVFAEMQQTIDVLVSLVEKGSEMNNVLAQDIQEAATKFINRGFLPIILAENQEEYQIALDELGSEFSAITQLPAAGEKRAFYVSRPLGMKVLGKWASHNFVVTDADYLGDPNAMVHSYGKTINGKVGRVDENTIGFSDGTHAEDIRYWQSLGTTPDPGVNAIQIPALSTTVREYAFSLIANQRYSPVGAELGANSNSAAHAIVHASTCQQYIIPPDGNRTSPGYKDYDEMEFVIPTDC